MSEGESDSEDDPPDGDGDRDGDATGTETAGGAPTAAPLDRATAACRDRFGAPTVVADAPGRVNLVGGHTDYNEGLVLPAAIDRRTAVAARPNGDGRIRVYSATVGETATVAPGDDPRGDWTDYVAGVARALRSEAEREAPNAPNTEDGSATGTDLAVASDVPPGAGLASSAALTVATGAALGALAGIDAPDRRLAALCRRAETEFVGVPCGILDQFAAVFGRRDRALALDCRSRDYEYVPLAGTDARIVAVDTNVEHDLAASAYDERRRTCRRGVDLLAGLLDREVDALRDVPRDAFERVDDDLPPTVRARCRHAIAENERVREATAALRAGEFDRAGACMDASHRSLREDYEVSCAELDAVVDVARNCPGVHGARMTGGGFGGSVVALVAPDAVDRFAARVAREYPDRTGIEPDVYRCTAADGYGVEAVGDGG